MVFPCVFPLGFDRRVVLMRFCRSEQSAQLMVLEVEILMEQWKELKHVEGTKTREESKRPRTAEIWVRNRSSERMERITRE